MDESRETGRVKDWRDKGFGFIERDQGGSLFCHARETPGRLGLTPGSRVSFLFEADDKTGKATQVQIEEAAEEENSPRETGTITRWNTEKGFGFIVRAQGGDDAFVHKKECGGNDLAVGQFVSFVFEDGAKGASAKNVKEEEGGETVVVVEEDEGEREFGKVKSYTEDKGFRFIGRCTGGDDLFAHKKEFGGVEPVAGMPVSFIVESTEKGDAAKKIRQEDSVPEFVLSDEGRDFGTIRTFLADKGYGFIMRKGGGDNARFFEKECNGFTPEFGKLVSFVLEETDKGPSAKILREEDPERVARVTAKVYYGRVDEYFDPTEKRPTNGYGFIKPFNSFGYGAPKRYYFHMSEVETPDEDGGIEPDTNVSFIVIPAKKGVQAAAVTIADPPKEKEKENEATFEGSFGGMEVKHDGNGDMGEGKAAIDDGWGTWGD